MPRTVRNHKLDTPSARARLPLQRSVYWVSLLPGCAFGYRKGRKGGVWVAKLVKGAVRRETTLGPADDVIQADGKLALSYAHAQELARAWFPRANHEDASDEEASGPYTVAAVVDDYLADYRRRGGKAARNTQIVVDAFIRPRLGATSAAELTAKGIGTWHAGLAATAPRLRSGAGTVLRSRKLDLTDPEVVRRRRATANRVLTVLKAALNHAFREGKIASDDAWRRVKPFREADAPKIRYLDEAETRRLVNATDPAFRPLVQAALLTGCRYGEIVAFQVSDFDRRAGTITVRASKGGRTRHVVLTADGIALFGAHTAGKLGSACIFTRPDNEPWGRSHQHRRLREACAAAKIMPPASFHVLRHTYATMLLRGGAPLPVIAANLGHADTRMTERHYAHLMPGYVAQTIRASMPNLGIVGGSNLTVLRQSTPGLNRSGAG
jgi:integrase